MTADANRHADITPTIVKQSFVVTLLMVGLSGCTTSQPSTQPSASPDKGAAIIAAQVEANSWAEAQASGSARAYRDFIRNHPLHPRLPEAKIKLEELDWQSTEKEASSQAYRRFLREHPESHRKAEGEAKAVELEWQDAKKNNTAAAYSAFLRGHPEGRFTEDAKAALKSLEEQPWQDAVKADSLDAFGAFYREFPRTQRKAAIHETALKLLNKGITGKKTQSGTDMRLREPHEVRKCLVIGDKMLCNTGATLFRISDDQSYHVTVHTDPTDPIGFLVKDGFLQYVGGTGYVEDSGKLWLFNLNASPR